LRTRRRLAHIAQGCICRYSPQSSLQMRKRASKPAFCMYGGEYFLTLVISALSW